MKVLRTIDRFVPHTGVGVKPSSQPAYVSLVEYTARANTPGAKWKTCYGIMTPYAFVDASGPNADDRELLGVLRDSCATADEAEAIALKRCPFWDNPHNNRIADMILKAKASSNDLKTFVLARMIGVDHSELYAIGRGAKLATKQMIEMLENPVM